VQEGAEGLTLAEAAARLGVSVDTVRRRIKRGELGARQVQTKFGPMWEVLLGAAPEGLPPPGNGVHGSAPRGSSNLPGAAPAPALGVTELVALVERQQQTIMELSGRVGFYQAQVEQLREQLALEAPKAEPVDVEPTAAAEAVSEPATRRWWRRVWRAVQV
jgi:excisionase family DNA binding protein